MAPQVEDLRKTAFRAEKDLNSYQNKQGTGKKSDSGMLHMPPFYFNCMLTTRQLPSLVSTRWLTSDSLSLLL